MKKDLVTDSEPSPTDSKVSEAQVKPSTSTPMEKETKEIKNEEKELPEKPTDAKTSHFLPALNLDLHDFDSKVAHHTDVFDHLEALYRRGQPITLTVRLLQKYDPQKHKISLFVASGSKPILSKGTLIKLDVQVSGESKSFGWTLARIPDGDFEGKDHSYNIKLKLTPSVNARIGIYKLAIRTQVDENPAILFQCKEELYLLFNPWHKDDATHMPNEDDIAEYVLNTNGVVFVGSDLHPRDRLWHYGQFEHGIIEIVFWFLEKAGLPIEYFDNPLIVSRSLAALINANDRGAFEVYKPSQPGLTPHQWPGSVSILNKLLQQRGDSVKYGSEWIFAAIYCTFSRALGIPCRVVTCYNAVVGALPEGILDVHWNTQHSIANEFNTHTSRIYHTWNEIWLKRPDLSPDLDGWQALDCSAHTGAESLYRLGPAPVKAISAGKLSVAYDTALFASIANGYIVHWQIKKTGDVVPVSMEVSSIGTKIVTKAKGSNNPECLLESYKLKELPASAKLNEIQSLLAKKEKNDVNVIVTPPDDVQKGDTVVLSLKFENTTKEPQSVKVFTDILFESCHTGNRRPCKRFEQTVSLTESETKVHNIKLRAEDYLRKLPQEYYLKAYIQVVDEDSKQIQAFSCNVQFDAHKVLYFDSTPTETEIEKTFQLAVNIRNPFHKNLRGCLLAIEGPSLSKIVNLSRPVKAQENVVYHQPCVLKKIGTFQYYVTLLSPEIIAQEACQIVKAVSNAETPKKESK
ncbi:hypothetical protein ACOME3_003813 [Neoechinorhynchus agilis]